LFLPCGTDKLLSQGMETASNARSSGCTEVLVANELSIPPEALAHRSVEVMRVWLANQKQHIVLNIGFWEDRGLDECEAWGIVIADMIHHIADAHELEYGYNPKDTIATIRKALEVEMDHPTSARLGEFVKEKRGEG
jgi:hypothetical protein